MQLALSIPDPNGNPIQIQTPIGIPTGGGETAATIISAFISLIFVISILLALVYIIWAGYNWMMSQGDKQKIASARNKILYALIGLIVMFISYIIINFIGEFFGISLTSATLPATNSDTFTNANCNNICSSTATDAGTPVCQASVSGTNWTCDQTYGDIKTCNTDCAQPCTALTTTNFVCPQ